MSVTGLAGCSGNPKITKTFTPTATESHRSETPQAVAEYQPATETSPAKNVPVPKYPEAAKAKTKAGQKAFIEYWFKTYNYAMDSGHTSELAKISDESCQFCQLSTEKTQEMHVENKTWRVGGTANINLSRSSRGPFTEGTHPWDVPVNEDAVQFFDEHGQSKKYSKASKGSGVMRVWLLRGQGVWIVKEVARVEEAGQ